MKFIHPRSKEYEKLSGTKAREIRVKSRQQMHQTTKRKEVNDLLATFRQNLQEKNVYTLQEMKKITVIFLVTLLNQVPTNRTEKVGHEIEMRTKIQQVRNGTFRVPDLTSEENVLNLKLWDGRLQTSQAIKLVPIEIPDIELLMQGKGTF